MKENPPAEPAPLCPLCNTALVWRPVSPCMECGGDPRELRMLEDLAHSYNEVLVFGEFSLVLCDFCQIDFGTYPSYFFGLPRHQHLGFNDLVFQQQIEPKLAFDWVCDHCGYRKGFLDFVSQLRARSSRT